MLGRAHVCLALMLPLACHRASEDAQGARDARSAARPSTQPAAQPGTQSGVAPTATPIVSASPTASTVPPPCVVPFPREPAPPAAPAAECPRDPGGAPALRAASVVFQDAPGMPRVQVEVADTPDAQARGLMYRTRMAEDHGMLFEWPFELTRTFWMRNTCIPLDMLFIAKDGTIGGILEQVPVLNEAPRSVACKAAYVLELNAGASRRLGLQSGMRVRIEK